MSIQREHIHAPVHLGDTIADAITAFVGSWTFLLLHVLWFSAWIVFRIEPFPFGLLTMIVSLEAIFLTTLVMMSQNRQAFKDRKRDDLESQEVSSLFETHDLLLKINHQQLEILQALKAVKNG